MGVIADIENELIDLGLTPVSAKRLTRHTLDRCLHHAADVHNMGHTLLLYTPDDATIDELPADCYPQAAAISLALHRAVRADSRGVCNPEMGLLMAYAAEAVNAALRVGRPTNPSRRA